MKKLLFLLSLLALVISCDNLSLFPDKSGIDISSPVPTEAITKVDLNPTEQGYVDAGNTMAFRFLNKMYKGDNLVLSPLCLQYGLAMTANGASGEALQEIIDFLGYGEEGIDVLNAYCKKMLEQLPAVDLNVTLKLVDAIIINDLSFQLNPSFKERVEKNYYAAVESMPFSRPGRLENRINTWAAQNTDGAMDNVLESGDVQGEAAAILINALYYKSQWAGNEDSPMFSEDNTKEDFFYLSSDKKIKIPFMQNVMYHKYAEMDGYKVLALPYASGKFNMFILLPGENDLETFIKKLPNVSWGDIRSSFKQDAEVFVKLPKFEIENKLYLKEPLKQLGVKNAFDYMTPGLDNMVIGNRHSNFTYLYLDTFFQKTKISVTEWGTEAAAKNVSENVALYTYESEPGEEPKQVYFYADHPFVFLIGEATSGAILFEGAYTGRAGE